ncbi:MAG: D-glycerate dehydrogenase [Spirochaetes bacterium]|nr:D-glycerate dehydrogenase [Spirochaetota bacterium]MBU0954228.1 D-glycerate dehydrogenase [Spirochaetota bacterium]
MKQWKVLVSRRIPQEGLDLLAEACELTMHQEDRPMTRSELLAAAAGKDGVLCLLTDKINAELFDAAPTVRAYANFAVGYDNMDVAEASRRRIPLSNTPDVLTDATADMAWALLFATARRVVESDAVMRSGSWAGWGPLQFIGGDITGATLGIVGAGRIGAAMTARSNGFRMRVLYTDARRNEQLEQSTGAVFVSFDELLRQSDYISVHVPLLPETRHLFNEAAFARMKPTACLINTARGPVIDEAALVRALRDKTIAGAGLDVYEHEPAMSEGLAALPNVVLTPHTASATHASRNGMARKAATNLLAMLRGERAPDCLNPEIYPG